MSLLTDRARLLLNLKEFLVWIQVYIQFFAKVLSHCKRRSKGKKRAESLHSSMLLQNSKKKKRVESLHSLRPFNHKFTDFCSFILPDIFIMTALIKGDHFSSCVESFSTIKEWEMLTRVQFTYLMCWFHFHITI